MKRKFFLQPRKNGRQKITLQEDSDNMKRHFEHELESLKTNLIKMGSVVEESIALAIKALLQRDAKLANKVIDGDARVNSLEMEIDNAIIDLLALQQPVAI